MMQILPSKVDPAVAEITIATKLHHRIIFHRIKIRFIHDKPIRPYPKHINYTSVLILYLPVLSGSLMTT
jgi:hypothetical protein